MAVPAILVELANVLLKELLKGIVREILAPLKQVSSAIKMFKGAKKWLDFFKDMKGSDKQAWEAVSKKVFSEVNKIHKSWERNIQPLINAITSQNRELGKSVAESIKNEANKFLADKMGLDKSQVNSKGLEELSKLVKGVQSINDKLTKLVNEQSEVIQVQNEIIKNQQQIIEMLLQKLQEGNQSFEKEFVPEKKKELEQTVEKIKKGKTNEIIDVVKGTGDNLDQNIGDFLPDDKNWKQNFYNDFSGEANNSFLNKILSEVERHLMYFDDLVADEWTRLTSEGGAEVHGVKIDDRKALFAKMFGLGIDGSSLRNERTGYKEDTPWAQLKAEHYANPDKSATELVNEFFLPIITDYFEDKYPDLETEILDYLIDESTAKE